VRQPYAAFFDIDTQSDHPFSRTHDTEKAAIEQRFSDSICR